MFEKIREMIGGEADAMPDDRPVPVTGEAADPAVSSGRESVMLRQEVVDGRRRVIGYELTLCPEPKAASPGCAKTLLSMMQRPDLRTLIERKFAFIAVCAGCPVDQLAQGLPRGHVVFGLRVAAGDDVDALVRAAGALKAAGFPLSLEDYHGGADLAPLLAVVDYVRIDLSQGAAACAADIAAVRAAGALPIAFNTASDGEFQLALSLGCTFFQGMHLQVPETTRDPTVAAQRAHVLELLNLTKVQADISDLEEVLRRDPMLSYYLLRYVNSPGGGLAQPVRSIAHALMVLGYQPLYRWLTLLLYSAGETDERGRALLRHALTRGRLIERLAVPRLGAGQRDGFYLTGMFSLLDALLGQPMASALSGISLARPVIDALLSRSGPYAPYLELALKCEGSDAAAASVAALGLGISAEELNVAHIEALIWADSVV